jgi:DNA-binding NtrC family response regulator
MTMTSRRTILLVDDDHGVLDVAARFATMAGFAVHAFDDPEAALAAAVSLRPDAALLDVMFPTGSGIELLAAIRRAHAHCDVVMMTGAASIPAAVDAVRQGASDYLAKPLDPVRLAEWLRRLRANLDRRDGARRVELDPDGRFASLVGHTAAMRELFDLIVRVAPQFTSVLVTGETGTGKDLVARALHRLSPRAERPFVSVNCSAIVETLFESELFGHVRGAFTGATEHRVGLFERASGGVLFLDEIGELPLTMQAKLLRVLETGEVLRVGSSDPRRVDVRVIAATNRPLEREVREGRFRADLYYRLNVVELAVPPLRDRKDDIPALVRHFIVDLGALHKRTLSDPTPEAERRLLAWDWPGNVRELRNVIERAVMLSESGRLELGDLRLGVESRARVARPGVRVRPIAELERDEIARALAETRGNKQEAARRLGISRRALYRRLEKFDLGRDRAA